MVPAPGKEAQCHEKNFVAYHPACSSLRRRVRGRASQDNTWLIGAHQDNLAEIQSGGFAAQNGHAAAVRNAGHMLETDHQKLDAKLKPVARQLGVTLPTQPNMQQRDQMKHLKTLSGMSFDTIWTHDETDGHVKAIEQTESEIEHGSDPQVQ